MTALAVTPFSFEKHQVRTLLKNGEPWFVAVDVCNALELTNPTEAIRRLDDDERDTLSLTEGIHNGVGNPNMNIISESGMYTLVLRCRDAVKPGTLPHRFRKWVTSEVLPQIRKTGSYQATSVPAKRQPPKFRYIITMTVQDFVTGKTETFKGGANNPDEIINGTARRFGMHIFDMAVAPVTAF